MSAIDTQNAGDANPAGRFFAITPHNTTSFEFETRGIYVGGAGDIVVVDRSGNAVLFASVPAGVILPVRAKRVNTTNTTATSLVGLY